MNVSRKSLHQKKKSSQYFIYRNPFNFVIFHLLINKEGCLDRAAKGTGLKIWFDVGSTPTTTIFLFKFYLFVIKLNESNNPTQIGINNAHTNGQI